MSGTPAPASGRPTPPVRRDRTAPGALSQRRAQAVLVVSAALLVASTTALALLFYVQSVAVARWGRVATDWTAALLMLLQVSSAAAGWWAARTPGPCETTGSATQPAHADPERAGELARCQSEREQLCRAVDRLHVIPVADRTVVVPLLGDVDVERVTGLQGALLEGIDRHRALVALIDWEGVDGFTPAAIAPLSQLLRAVELMGCHVLLTGMSRHLVRALLDSDVELAAETARDIATGLSRARNLLAGSSAHHAGQPRRDAHSAERGE